MNFYQSNQDIPKELSVTHESIAARVAAWNVVRQVREAGGNEIEQKTAELTIRYGELMTVDEVAEALRRAPSALRYTLNSSVRREAPWARRLLAGRRKLGRRVFFAAWAVADAIINGDSQFPAPPRKVEGSEL